VDVGDLTPLLWLSELLPWDVALGLLVFLYLGPETVLPVASVLAAVLGVLLIFWRHVVALARKAMRALRRRSGPPSSADEGEAGNGELTG
jgi:hypothetical protein